MPSLYPFPHFAPSSLRANEIPRNELLVSISSPSSRLPSQSSSLRSSCSLCRATSAAESQSHLPFSSRVLESVRQETRTMFARDRLFKSRFVPGIRLEIARNFVEAISSGLFRLVRSLTMLRNWNASLPRDPPISPLYTLNSTIRIFIRFRKYS